MMEEGIPTKRKGKGPAIKIKGAAAVREDGRPSIMKEGRPSLT